jgi:hypothetical protein
MTVLAFSEAYCVKSNSEQPQTPAIASGNLYRFQLECEFDVQDTFAESEVWPLGGDEAGFERTDETDFEPTDDALEGLAGALEYFLDSEGFAIHSVEAATAEPESFADWGTDDFSGYNFTVFFSFKLDVFLDGSKVEIDTSKRSKSYIRPTDAALEELGKGLAESLSYSDWPVDDVEVSTKPENLRKCVTLVIPKHLYNELPILPWQGTAGGQAATKKTATKRAHSAAKAANGRTSPKARKKSGKSDARRPAKSRSRDG